MIPRTDKEIMAAWIGFSENAHGFWIEWEIYSTVRIQPPVIELFFKNLLEIFLEQIFHLIIIFIFRQKIGGLITVDFV